jgi:hypothetical protein
MADLATAAIEGRQAARILISANATATAASFNGSLMISGNTRFASYHEAVC